MKLNRLLFSLTVLMACGVPSAGAQLLLFFEPAAQQIGRGEMISYRGTLTNSGTSNLFINSNSYTFNVEGITFDDSPLLANAPISLAAGESSDLLTLFSVTAASTAPVGDFNGTLTVLGGANDTASLEIGSGNFRVSVVPSPNAFWVFVFGLGSFIFLRKPLSTR